MIIMTAVSHEPYCATWKFYRWTGECWLIVACPESIRFGMTFSMTYFIGINITSFLLHWSKWPFHYSKGHYNKINNSDKKMQLDFCVCYWRLDGVCHTCRYNAVNFHPNPQERRLIARHNACCLMWTLPLMHILPKSLSYHMQNHVMLDHIMALDCTISVFFYDDSFT